ncbi:3-isopropylmalate dehydratase small subunit [Allostella sp. ATCC 35155]|nr:3-isopropylmalate dehydratase small subunit [Stella sp. ATCC 35155]
MEPFVRVASVAAPLPIDNVDTDVIIPAEFGVTMERGGLGPHAFNGLRRFPDGSERPDFVLNREPWRHAKILVAGANFGCGSSREHAPWALRDFGFRAIVAPSFADIFYGNCFRNGILPVRLPAAVVTDLMEQAGQGANAVFTIDLESQALVAPDGTRHDFAVDPWRRRCLLEGLDEIGATLAGAAAIERFEAGYARRRPWAARAG